MSVDIHFLNVGSGDCTIIHFPARSRKDGREMEERVMMVDLYHYEYAEDCEDVIAYYKKHFGEKPIFRFVCTHPHQDHICGLHTLMYGSDIRILNFWDLSHDFEPEDFEGHPTHEQDWDAYRTLGRGGAGATVLRYTRETKSAQFWDDDEDRITILSPSKDLIRVAHIKEDGSKRKSHEVEIDEMSFALMITVNSRRIILGGDGRDVPFWKDIYENCDNLIKNCAVLKASHHGHLSGFHRDAVKLMNPEYIVFSNSIDEDAENGAEKEYKAAVPGVKIRKTYLHGSFVLKVPFEEDEKIEEEWTQA